MAQDATGSAVVGLDTPTSPNPAALPPPKLKKYASKDDIDVEVLAQRAREIYGKDPFKWQLRAATAILAGQDLILDVGTGCGKSLCFVLPLLLDEHDVGITVVPLTALMLDQVKNAKIPTLPISRETLEERGRDTLYNDAASGKFRHIICSPEIFKTPLFKQKVMSKLAEHLRVVSMDEAHCISLWGGSFRPDYAEMGDVRAIIPSNVPLLLASASWTESILNEARRSVGLSKTAARISITNARPNVALSVRAMQFEEKSKADLRFLIPVNAKKPEDIPVTLVYANERLKVERAAERLQQWVSDEGIPADCVGFYHAKVGPSRKRELEAMLADGRIRILCCTDAVGMGCDMRNVDCVVLWELPPSFCALIQRAGRAVRDLSKTGEAILILTKAALMKGKKEIAMDAAVAVEGAALEAEAQNDDEELPAGVEVNSGREEILVNEGGVRRGHDSDGEDGDGSTPIGGSGVLGRQRRWKRGKVECEEREAKYLQTFASGEQCLAKVWDGFFENDKKEPLIPGINTLWKPIAGQRCCNRCSPDLFPVEKIVLEKTRGLKRGRRRPLPERLVLMLGRQLKKWRPALAEELFPGIEGIAGETVLGDDVISQIVSCGERIDSAETLGKYTRWFLGFQDAESQPLHLTPAGTKLIAKLADIYTEFDDLGADGLTPLNGPIPQRFFYGPPKKKARASLAAGATSVDGCAKGGRAKKIGDQRDSGSKSTSSASHGSKHGRPSKKKM